MVAKKSFILLLYVLVLFLSVLPSFVRADLAGTANDISTTRNQLVNCYDKAREAEAAGANITELTGVLNRAGLLLSQAEFEFSNGDFIAAQDYAVQSQGELANFVLEANRLSMVAAAQSNQDFLINVFGSTGGTVAVLVGSWGLWSFLKKRSKNEKKQEVESVAV